MTKLQNIIKLVQLKREGYFIHHYSHKTWKVNYKSYEEDCPESCPMKHTSRCYMFEISVEGLSLCSETRSFRKKGG